MQVKPPKVNPLWEAQCLTLSNLRLSPQGEQCLRSFNKEQRKALYDLCCILHLTFYDPSMRAAAQELRELLRKNTLNPQVNLCEFDKSEKQKKLESRPIRSSSTKYAKDN